MFIVTASNDNYAQHLGVLLTSLLENSNNIRNTHIFIIDANLSVMNIAKLRRAVRRFNKKITFLRIDEKVFESFAINPQLKYITIETYYRIVIPDLLSCNISKALYLDCDIIIQSDITKLWKVDLGNHYLAAVDIACLKPEFNRKMRNNRLSIPENSSYFNAGVLLMNLKKWRTENIPTRLTEFIMGNPRKLKLMDQDALNAVLYDKWLKLDPKWNYTTTHQKKMPLIKPTIIHFTGKKKPWNSDSPYKLEYMKYLQSSLWEQDI